MSDRLTLSRALEEGGIPRDAAEHIATEILDAIHDNVATKTDLAAIRSELKADIAAVRSELKADIAALRAEIALVEHRLMTRLGGAIAVAVGIILAAIRFLPHG
jgi:hypothetical protein